MRVHEQHRLMLKQHNIPSCELPKSEFVLLARAQRWQDRHHGRVLLRDFRDGRDE